MTLLSSSWLAPAELADEREADGVERLLAERAQEGDKKALKEIYDRYAPGVLRFLRDMLRDNEAAADALQETFIRVFQKIGSLEDPSKLVAWMFGIARHVCREHKRRATRQGWLERIRGARWFGDEADDQRVPAEHGIDSLTPEAILLGAESAESLDRALAALSADRRAIFLLRSDHLLAYEEIAVSMGCSVAKVKVELHRARLALRAVVTDGAMAGEGGVR